MVLMHLYKYDEAIRNFKEAIHLQPEYANAHFYLSEILKRKGLSAEAEYHLNEAIRINSEYKNIDKLQSRHNIGK
jgi:tetratricopeptide (TPR) repeat protein